MKNLPSNKKLSGNRRSFIRSAGILLGGAAFSSKIMPDFTTNGRENNSGQSGRKRQIIDSHCHLKHGDREKTEYTPEFIIEVMDKVGIDRSVVFAMSTSTKDSIVRAEAAVKKFPDRLIPYVYALPSYESAALKDIERVLDKGLFKGIKIHKGECTLAPYVIDPVLKLAGKYKAPCLIDLGGDMESATRMVTSFPETPFIIAHMGRYLAKDEKLLDSFITLAEQNQNTYLDLSGVIVPSKVIDAIKRLGSLRLFWGIDGPHPEPNNITNSHVMADNITYAGNELKRITSLDLSPEDENNILGRSISRLLKI
jgi:predicted TIM-barrel fold metal-dependent hydrolase